jgi:hypothetical protein
MPTVIRPYVRPLTGRLARRLLVCVLALGPAAVLVVPGTAASAPPTPETTAPPNVVDAQPGVTIRTLRPSRLQPAGAVTIAGTVHNTTGETWRDAQISMVVSGAPITSTAELTNLRLHPEELVLLDVLTEGAAFQDLGNLEPGIEVAYSLRNEFDDLQLTGASGVYVVGVEVRGTPEDGPRRKVAGANTFMPLVGEDADLTPVDVAMFWPLEARVPRIADAYATDSLAADFDLGGRLSDLTSMGASAGDFPLSWIVDPAVLDAADDMSDGYQLTGGARVPEDGEGAVAAGGWLSRTQAALSGADVWAVPYGDPDVASLAHGLARGDAAGAVLAASEAGVAARNRLGVPARSLLWPALGMADQEVLDTAAPMAPRLVLLATQSVRRPTATASVTVHSGGSDTAAVLYDRTLTTPLHGQTMLQWRQQLLAASALEALAGGGSMLVAPPRNLAPDAGWREADFFAQLRGSWLRPMPVDPARLDAADSEPRLRYPRRARRDELPAANLDAISSLLRASASLTNLLAEPATSRQPLGEAIGISASVQWREDPVFGAALAQGNAAAVEDRLAAIVVETPPFVTLSGQEGRFPVTISNGLSQPVTVGVEVRADNDSLQIEPIEPLTIDPEQRRSITVNATYRGVGISNVLVTILDRTGAPFGASATLQVRTTQIGAAIWVVMAAGGTIVLIAVARSIARRVRGRDTGRPTR